MEKIKKALEKARVERKTFGDSAQPIPARSKVVSTRRKTNFTRRSSLPEEIQYTETQNIEVSAEFLRDQRVIAGMGPCSFIDAFKVLRTKVFQSMRANDWNVLGITSPGKNEGKSLTAVNLAISLALEVNQTVLLVDANLRHPSLHEYFGFAPQFGLSDYLIDDIGVEKILVHPKGIGRFVLLPGHKPMIDSSEMLSSPKMVQLVDELKNRYSSRLVIFDLPDLGTSDAIAFAPYVDAALLVVEAGQTRKDDISKAYDLLKATRPIGTVLNKVDPQVLQK